MFGVKKDANLPLTRNKGFDNYRRLPITYFGKGFSYRAALEKYLSDLGLKGWSRSYFVR